MGTALVVLWLKKRKRFTDKETGVRHPAGDRWIMYGPGDYVPPVDARILERREPIALGENSGVYVKNVRTGDVSLQ